jgi:hypothetical protein
LIDFCRIFLLRDVAANCGMACDVRYCLLTKGVWLLRLLIVNGGSRRMSFRFSITIGVGDG